MHDDDLGELKMQNLMFRLEDTPGAIRFPGRRLGAGQRGGLRASCSACDADELAQLREAGVV